MNILMAASECVPFVKVGGLADVVGTLPRFLKAQGHDVRIIIPKYGKIDGTRFKLRTLPYRLSIPIGPAVEEVTLKEGRAAGDVTVYFVENAKYFFRPEVYGTAIGDYPDNRERFILFCRAVLESMKALMFKPDLIHCHDWQSGIIPAYLKTTYRFDGYYHRTASAFTIHNIAYQGDFPMDTLDLAGLPRAAFTWDKLEHFGRVNFLKAGLVYADVLSTVSPTYAKEIQTPAFGCSMEATLKHRSGDVAGILNGIDCDEWNPGNDPRIAAPFSISDLSNKARCKEDLQRTCGLPTDPRTMLIGAVSRLAAQKGFDLVARVLPELMAYNAQLVILGKGDRDIQDALAELARRYPGRISVKLEFNNDLAHKIYAGSDLFLMPSRFEPCGLGQMIAMAYGTLPLVNRTGGLADTVAEYDRSTGEGTGFVFTPAVPAELMKAIARAQTLFADPISWNRAMNNAMNTDFSWQASVDEYEELYRKATDKRKI